jgi:hypothetical protein
MNFLKSASREAAERTIRKAATIIIWLSTIALAGLTIIVHPAVGQTPPGGFLYIVLLSSALALRRSKSRVAAGLLVFLSACGVVTGLLLLWSLWDWANSGHETPTTILKFAIALSIFSTFSLWITVRALQATMMLKKAFKNEPPPLPVTPNPRVMEQTCSMALGGEASDHFPHDEEFFYSPAAPIGRLRQWKIALSLAVVGALAAPFAFGTYKARPWYEVPVPLTAQQKEELASDLRTTNEELASDDCRFHNGYERWCRNLEDFKREIARELETDTREEARDDRSKYWMMNVGVAAATAVSLFGLAYSIPMLIRGVAFLARRYWRWLNA